MESDNSLLSVSHATSMPQRLRLYRWLCLVLLVVVLLAAGSTVSAPVAPPEVVRGTRLEIVNDAGQVVLRAEAQQAGGVLQLWSAQGTLSLALRAHRWEDDWKSLMLLSRPFLVWDRHLPQKCPGIGSSTCGLSKDSVGN